jgi:hypothetical protein
MNRDGSTNIKREGLPCVKHYSENPFFPLSSGKKIKTKSTLGSPKSLS